MSFAATVIPVMIASPGDVHEYRAQARDVLHEWNYIHSDVRHAVLMPVGWDTQSSPELGSSPQELINDRILEDCDLLIGIFWTRLGTPTGRAASGTVEEVQRHVQAGKPAMPYFCDRPADLNTVDLEQYKALKEFRSWCQTQGLVEIFLNAAEFGSKLQRHVQIALQKNEYLSGIALKGQPPSVQGALPSQSANYAKAASALSPEAESLLLAAACEKSGTIIAVSVLAGRPIQAGNQQFGDMENRRSMAKWDYGLQQLNTLGLIRPISSRGKSDDVFELVEDGYRVAELIRSQNR